MKSAFRAAALLVLLFPSFARAGKKPYPAPPFNGIYNEGVVSPRAEDRIGRKLRGVEEQTGHQFMVALFRSLDGEGPDDYANRLFHEWRVGSRRSADGLLFVLFRDDGAWRVEVGPGLASTLTDREAAGIATDAAAASLRQGDYDAAVFAIVEALRDRLGGTSSSPIRIRPARLLSDEERWAVLGLVLLLLLDWACLRPRRTG